MFNLNLKYKPKSCYFLVFLKASGAGIHVHRGHANLSLELRLSSGPHRSVTIAMLNSSFGRTIDLLGVFPCGRLGSRAVPDPLLHLLLNHSAGKLRYQQLVQLKPPRAYPPPWGFAPHTRRGDGKTAALQPMFNPVGCGLVVGMRPRV